MSTNDKDNPETRQRKKKNSPYAEECDSKRIDYVTLYAPKLSLASSSSSSSSAKLNKKKKARRPWKGFHFFFFATYVYQLYWIASTVGVPYREFLEKAEREGFEVMEGTTRMRAELKHAMADISNPDRPTAKIGWFDWMNMDIEEHAERKRREREKTVLDALPRKMRVPPRYSPSFWSLLATGILVTCHALVVLLQHWLVGFNVWLNYKVVSAKEMDIPDDEEYDELTSANTHASASGAVNGAPPGVSPDQDEDEYDFAASCELPSHEVRRRRLPTHARIRPSAKRAKDLLVPVTFFPTLGATFEYQRRRYAWNAQVECWTKIRCRTDMPITFFTRWDGFDDVDRLKAARLRFGLNEFDVKQPTFQELYKAQLLSPFTVFQLFCVILWMLDEYWQYSAFTLFMILTFEGTVVLSRIKSLAALKGMGSKTRRLYVHRMGRWRAVESTSLLPGDIVSLTRHRPKPAAASSGDGKVKASPPTDDGGDIVPADFLLLRGFTVANEASLTGESVPQMKEGMSDLSSEEALAMKGKDKMHILYAGTKLLQCKGASEVDNEEEDEEEKDPAEPKDKEENDNNEDDEEPLASTSCPVPNPPDDGCVCFVLRTGFSSAQGKLVRMIEGSQEKVKGHEKETGLLLLMLFCFAVTSSGYVLYKGMSDDNRSKYELLLHCILIITSVIPPELPMQMALAVNQSLMTLMRMQVFCTEPYRVPIAGKLDSCLFDKTGTLTTDELVAVGVAERLVEKDGKVVKKVHPSMARGKKDGGGGSGDMTPMTQLQNEAGFVLAGCHSLVLVDDETAGDPLEAAALSAMRWRVTSAPASASGSRKTKGSSGSGGLIKPCLATDKRSAGKPCKVEGSNVSAVEIVARHHFSSKLQRMSCVVRDGGNGRAYVVAKGSPEAIGNLLAQRPEGYDAKAKALAKEGYRVIALSYRRIRGGSGSAEEGNAISSRVACEKDLVFAGFVAFTCRVRKDTKEVLKRLLEGGMTVAMVTGDAILTAAHVAKEVGICDPDPGAEPKSELEILIKQKRGKDERKKILMLEREVMEEEDDGEDGPVTKNMFWQSYEDESKVADFVASEVPELSKKYDLATTGKNLSAAFEYDEETKKVLWCFKIFARMTPDAKETVIECLHSVGLLCLMCGDGANDVGALKQADVGVALLSGFGDVNVDKGQDADDKKKKAAESGEQVTAMITQGELDQLRQLPVRLIKGKIRNLGVDPDEYPDLVEKEDLINLYRIKAKEKAVREHDRKNAIAKAKMTKAEMQAKQRAEVMEKQKKMMERVQELEAQGVQFAQFKAMKEFMSGEWESSKKKKAELQKQATVEGSAAAMVAQFEDLDSGDVPMVKLGDASIAAPFTSKMPSIRSCVDIIRQGRCTLVTSMQMYQILALNCLISAYSLSVLYLDGVKYGDTQMTAMGLLGSVSYMSVSRSKPLNKLSSVQPLTSIFHPSLFVSLLGQFTVHLTTMILAVSAAKEHLPKDYAVDLDGEFKPGIVNSVVFLVSSVQQVTVFVVNLQGRPFMTGLTENRPLLWSLLATFILTFMFASESVPGLNKYFQLVPFPDEEFRDFILKILVADVAGAFCFDRLMKFLFCPKILFASMKGTTVKDVLMLGRTIGMVFALMYFLLGNDEQWEEMMREEGRLDELNATNTTLDDGVGLGDGVMDSCTGPECNLSSNLTGATDEF